MARNRGLASVFIDDSRDFLRCGQMIVTGNPAISNPTRSAYFRGGTANTNIAAAAAFS